MTTPPYTKWSFPKKKQRVGSSRLNGGLALAPTENPRVFHYKSKSSTKHPELGELITLPPYNRKFVIVHVERIFGVPGVTGINSRVCGKLEVADVLP